MKTVPEVLVVIVTRSDSDFEGLPPERGPDFNILPLARNHFCLQIVISSVPARKQDSAQRDI